MMNNIEKKLDALIDALGFDVEIINSKEYGETVRLGFMARACGGKEWEYLPDEEVYKEIVSAFDYKLTKRGIKTTKGLRGYLHECFNGNNEPQHYCDDCGQRRTLNPDDVIMGDKDD